MINDLNETLKQLLIEKAELSASQVVISFEMPTQEWSARITSPTVNLYLYDIRENLELREVPWGQGRANFRRSSVWMDLSYMITCWAGAIENEHWLLWQVLKTLFKHSPLSEKVLKDAPIDLTRPVRTLIAQRDGVFQKMSDFWSTIGIEPRPAISLVVTLELDLDQVNTPPRVRARVLQVEQLDEDKKDWETAPLQLAGIVRDSEDKPIAEASVRIVKKDDPNVQVGPTIKSDADGRYLFNPILPGEYRLVIEGPGASETSELIIPEDRSKARWPILIHKMKRQTSSTKFTKSTIRHPQNT